MAPAIPVQVMIPISLTISESTTQCKDILCPCSCKKVITSTEAYPSSLDTTRSTDARRLPVTRKLQHLPMFQHTPSSLPVHRIDRTPYSPSRHPTIGSIAPTGSWKSLLPIPHSTSHLGPSSVFSGKPGTHFSSLPLYHSPST